MAYPKLRRALDWAVLWLFASMFEMAAALLKAAAGRENAADRQRSER